MASTLINAVVSLLLLGLAATLLLRRFGGNSPKRKREKGASKSDAADDHHDDHPTGDHHDDSGSHDHDDHPKGHGHGSHGGGHGHGGHGHGPPWTRNALELSVAAVILVGALVWFDSHFGGPTPATRGAQALAERSLARGSADVQTVTHITSGPAGSVDPSQVMHGVAPTGDNWLTITPPDNVHMIMCREDDPDCREKTVEGVVIVCKDPRSGIELPITSGLCDYRTNIVIKAQSASSEQVPVFWFYRPR